MLKSSKLHFQAIKKANKQESNKFLQKNQRFSDGLSAPLLKKQRNKGKYQLPILSTLTYP